MTTISPFAKLVTLINVFTVQPEQQQQLVDLLEDYQAMRVNPAPLPYLQQALTIARFEPGMYEVVATYSAPDETADAGREPR